MPLEREKTRENYIKVQKLYVSSADRNENSKGPYEYQIDLDTEIQYVVGIEITGFNFPSEIAPSFVRKGANFNGTNVVDFELQAGALEKVFTFEWPEKKFSYENVAVPYLSYVQTLQQLMNNAIQNDPDFGYGGANEAIFLSYLDPEEVTSVAVFGSGVTGFRFLFASGPNSDDSAFNAMGYNKSDTAFTLNENGPGRVNLQPFRYIDVNVKEAQEFKPLKRIYTTNNLYYGTVRNDPSITRTRLLSSQPILRLKKLNVSITLEGGVVPPIFQGLDHEITFTIFSIANETFVPDWVRQVFVL